MRSLSVSGEMAGNAKPFNVQRLGVITVMCVDVFISAAGFAWKLFDLSALHVHMKISSRIHFLSCECRKFMILPVSLHRFRVAAIAIAPAWAWTVIASAAGRFVHVEQSITWAPA